MTGMREPQLEQRLASNIRPDRISWKVRLGAYVEACRLDLIFYSGLVGLVGAVLASDHWEVLRLVGVWAAPTLGWIAAMYGGDYFDRKLDAIAKPHRPIPSGRMTAAEAFGGMVLGIALGTVIAVVLNPWNLIVVVITAFFGISYSRWFKARGIWGNVFRGGVTAGAFTLGIMSTGQPVPLELLPLALVFWLHDSGSNIIGTICDREGDRQGGYQTIPVKYGDGVALRILLVFDALWVALALGYPWLLAGRFAIAPYLAFLSVALLAGLVTLAMLYRAPRPISRFTALAAHEVLVVGRLVLAAAFVAAAGSTWLALILLVPSVTGTVAASGFLMRPRYEPRRKRWYQREVEDPRRAVN
ncbi:MAG: UbiA family prenyltransferase [Micromonosporaceae bacterium]